MSVEYIIDTDKSIRCWVDIRFNIVLVIIEFHIYINIYIDIIIYIESMIHIHIHIHIHMLILKVHIHTHLVWYSFHILVGCFVGMEEEIWIQFSRGGT